MIKNLIISALILLASSIVHAEDAVLLACSFATGNEEFNAKQGVHYVQLYESTSKATISTGKDDEVLTGKADFGPETVKITMMTGRRKQQEWFINRTDLSAYSIWYMSADITGSKQPIKCKLDDRKIERAF